MTYSKGDYMKNGKILLLTALLFTSIAFGSLIGNVRAQTFDTELRVIATPHDISPNLGQTNFTVSIIAFNVTGDATTALYGWEFILSWQAFRTDVNCTAETLNYDIWGAGNFLGPWVASPIDNAAGTYHQSLTGKAPGVAQAGTFWLANLTFTALVSGEPAVTVILTPQPAPGFTYCLLDKSANEIPHEFINGEANIIPEFPTFILPILMGLTVSALLATKAIRKRKPI